MTTESRSTNLNRDRIQLSIGVVSLYAAIIFSLIVFIPLRGNLIQKILHTALVIWMGGGVLSLFIFLVLSLLHLKFKTKDVISEEFPFRFSKFDRGFFFDFGVECIASSFIYGIIYAPILYFEKNFLLGMVVSGIIASIIALLAQLSSRKKKKQ